MSIFVTSDTHFWHNGILRHRPFETVEEMNETLVKNWNSVVGPDDTVYHLGDVVVWGKHPNDYDILDRLHGKIHLILGNHDRLTALADRSGVQAYLNGRKRYESVRELCTIKHKNQKVILCHYPMAEWDSSHHRSLQLHGHSHGNFIPPPGALQMDVGVDCHNFHPILLDEIFQHFNL